MEHPKLVVAQTYGSSPEAEMARGILEDAGIPAMTSADTAGRMREHLAWSGAGFQVVVREEDLDDARELLAPTIKSSEGSDAELKDDEESWPPWKRFS